MLLEINSQFALQLVELLCGGKPKRLLPVRELTDIEISIIQNMLNFFVNSMKEAWQDVVEVSPSLESLQTNPQLNQTMSPTESVALITFVLEVADMQSFANLCIPYMSIEKVVDKLDMQYWFKTHSYQDNLEYTTAIKEKLPVYRGGIIHPPWQHTDYSGRLYVHVRGGCAPAGQKNHGTP